MSARPFAAAALAAVLAGCTSSGGSPIESDEATISTAAIGQLPSAAAGDWTIPASELPAGIAGRIPADSVLRIRIVVAEEPTAEYVGGFEVSFGCSNYGGGVKSFDPVEYTLSTIEGVGDCADLDLAAEQVLRQVDGSAVVTDGDTLTIQLDETPVLLTRDG